jgi:hypothetical protein
VTPASWSLIATVDTRHTALGPDTSSGLLVAHHFDDREVPTAVPRNVPDPCCAKLGTPGARIRVASAPGG